MSCPGGPRTNLTVVHSYITNTGCYLPTGHSRRKSTSIKTKNPSLLEINTHISEKGWHGPPFFLPILLRSLILCAVPSHSLFSFCRLSTARTRDRIIDELSTGAFSAATTVSDLKTSTIRTHERIRNNYRHLMND